MEADTIVTQFSTFPKSLFLSDVFAADPPGKNGCPCTSVGKKIIAPFGRGKNLMEDRQFGGEGRPISSPVIFTVQRPTGGRGAGEKPKGAAAN